jgi:hypothetical protein
VPIFFEDGLRFSSIIGFSKGVPSHFDFECVMKKPIAKGIGEGGFSEGSVPVFGGELAGEDGGGPAVSIFYYFEEIGSFLIGEWRQEDVVYDEDMNFGEFGKEFEP